MIEKEMTDTKFPPRLTLVDDPYCGIGLCHDGHSPDGSWVALSLQEHESILAAKLEKLRDSFYEQIDRQLAEQAAEYESKLKAQAEAFEKRLKVEVLKAKISVHTDNVQWTTNTGVGNAVAARAILLRQGIEREIRALESGDAGGEDK